MTSGELRKWAGDIVFNKWIHPPAAANDEITLFQGDYGHGFYYEELFSGDGTDVRFAVRECLSSPGAALDLGGGAGRLSIALSCRGVPVTLVDCSETMLECARHRRSLLSLTAQSIFTIYPQDIRSLHLDQRYQHIFSFNNVLEHFSKDEDILRTLRAVYRHLEPHGRFYADVHFNGYLEKDPTWKLAQWRYIQDHTVDGRRFRVWSRTLPTDTESDVICEHAISENISEYTILRTTLRVYALELWMRFFETAGFKPLFVWGNWNKAPVTPETPKLVFALEK